MQPQSASTSAGALAIANRVQTTAVAAAPQAAAGPRVYKKKPKEGLVTQRMFFVKWLSLSYIECTWEWESDIIVDARGKIDEFFTRKEPPGHAVPLAAPIGVGAANNSAAPITTILPIYKVKDRGAASVLGPGSLLLMQALFAIMASRGLRQK